MELVAYARVCWGRWVADCPRDGCTQAEHFGVDPATRHVGGLGGKVFRCGTEGTACHCGVAGPAGCGLVCAVVWPENVEAIEKLLALRPAEQTRNWTPGEDLVDLMAENVAHGVGGPAAGQVEAGYRGGRLLMVTEREIVTDRLGLDYFAARRALGRG